MSSFETVGDRKIVTFSLANQTFGIDMSSLIEIREWETPTPLPTVPGYIKGVTNLRGNVVPVIGLAERLGWEPSKIHARSCVLVVSIGDKQAGFLVDEVSDIVTIGSQEVQPAPDVQIGDERVIQGLVRITGRTGEGKTEKSEEESGQMVLLLDLDALSLTRHLDLAA